jgi:hypothetical protein
MAEETSIDGGGGGDGDGGKDDGTIRALWQESSSAKATGAYT